MTKLSDKEIAKVLDNFTPGSRLFLIDVLRKVIDAATPGLEVTPAPPGGGAPPPSAPPPGAQPPNKPSGEMTLEQIYEQLADLTLPARILQQAEPIFARFKYSVSRQMAKSQSDWKIQRPFTLAEREDGVKLALINVPQQVYLKNLVWGSLMDGIEEIDAHVRIVSEDFEKNATPGFVEFLNSANQRGKKWDYIPWDWVREFLGEKETIERVFKLPKSGESPSTLRLEHLTQGDRKQIEEWLTDLAADNVAKPVQRLRSLANAAGWSKDIERKLAGYGDDPHMLAVSVVRLAIEQENFQPATHSRYGDTYLGALMQALVPQVDYETRKEITKLILRYNLVNRKDSVAEVKKHIAD